MNAKQRRVALLLLLLVAGPAWTFRLETVAARDACSVRGTSGNPVMACQAIEKGFAFWNGSYTMRTECEQTRARFMPPWPNASFYRVASECLPVTTPPR